MLYPWLARLSRTQGTDSLYLQSSIDCNSGRIIVDWNDSNVDRHRSAVPVYLRSRGYKCEAVKFSVAAIMMVGDQPLVHLKLKRFPSVFYRFIQSRDDLQNAFQIAFFKCCTCVIFNISSHFVFTNESLWVVFKKAFVLQCSQSLSSYERLVH